MFSRLMADGFWVNHLTHVKIRNMEKPTAIKASGYKDRSCYQRHQKQKFWQIMLPVILGILLVLVLIALVILTAVGGDPSGQVSVWADTSLIWMILPVMAFAVVSVLILGGLIYLLAKLLKIVPAYTSLVQNYAELIAAWVKYIANKIVSPFIAVKSAQAATSKFFEKLLAFFHQP